MIHDFLGCATRVRQGWTHHRIPADSLRAHQSIESYTDAGRGVQGDHKNAVNNVPSNGCQTQVGLTFHSGDQRDFQACRATLPSDAERHPVRIAHHLSKSRRYDAEELEGTANLSTELKRD
jgi:hypothetical protein